MLKDEKNVVYLQNVKKLCKNLVYTQLLNIVLIVYMCENSVPVFVPLSPENPPYTLTNLENIHSTLQKSGQVGSFNPVLVQSPTIPWCTNRVYIWIHHPTVAAPFNNLLDKAIVVENTPSFIFQELCCLKKRYTGAA